MSLLLIVAGIVLAATGNGLGLLLILAGVSMLVGRAMGMATRAREAAAEPASADAAEPDFPLSLTADDFRGLAKHVGHLVRVHGDAEGHDVFECVTCRSETPVPRRMFPSSGKLHRWGSCGPRYVSEERS